MSEIESVSYSNPDIGSGILRVAKVVQRKSDGWDDYELNSNVNRVMLLSRIPDFIRKPRKLKKKMGSIYSKWRKDTFRELVINLLKK